MSAGRLNKKSLGIVMLLSIGLLLAGCSGSKSSDTGTYSGSVYTVKRGDTLYRISRTTGTSVKELARLNGISPPYTIEVGQKLKLGGAKSSSKYLIRYTYSVLNIFKLGHRIGYTVISSTEIFLAASRATLLVMANDRESYHAVFDS